MLQETKKMYTLWALDLKHSDERKIDTRSNETSGVYLYKIVNLDSAN
jgi:hypothetical protein